MGIRRQIVDCDPTITWNRRLVSFGLEQLHDKIRQSGRLDYPYGLGCQDAV